MQQPCGNLRKQMSSGGRGDSQAGVRHAAKWWWLRGPAISMSGEASCLSGASAACFRLPRNRSRARSIITRSWLLKVETVGGLTQSACPLRHFRGLFTHANTGAVGQNDSPLNGVLQFPHVARPVVSHQRAHRIGRNVRHMLLDARLGAAQELVHERWNIVATVAQRRHCDHERP